VLCVFCLLCDDYCVLFVVCCVLCVECRVLFIGGCCFVCVWVLIIVYGLLFIVHLYCDWFIVYYLSWFVYSVTFIVNVVLCVCLN